jgi:signal transduction histidine kinase
MTRQSARRPAGPDRSERLARVAEALWDADSMTRRLIGLVGLGAIVYNVLAGSLTGEASQRGPAVLVLTVVGSVAYLLWLVLRRGSLRLTAVTLLVMAVAGAVLGGLAPGGGLTFSFLAAFGAGRRLPAWAASLIVMCAAAALTITGLTTERLTGLNVLGLSVGLAAVTLGGLNRAERRRVQDQAALLLAEGQVVMEERARSAALDERARIAREIHDVLAHSLSGLMVQLEAAHLLLAQSAEPARVAGHVDRARGLARSGIEETRRALQTLRGEPLPTADLLGELVKAYQADTGCPGRLRVTGTPRPLPAEVGLTVYRVAQEALTNTRRHAPGRRAEVHMDYQEAAVSLAVSDHRSVGEQQPAPMPSAIAEVGGGYGLVGMRERAELLGGELTVGPTTDGWQVNLRILT